MTGEKRSDLARPALVGLSSDGEAARLDDQTNRTIMEFRYGDDCHDETDSLGILLTVVNATDPGLGARNAGEARRTRSSWPGNM